MKLLTRIGYTGEKALIGVEYDCQSQEILLIRTQFSNKKLSIEESLVFQETQMLQDYLLKWPALALLLRLKHAGAIEKWVPRGTEDKIKAILGVGVENPQDFIYEVIEGSSDKQLLSLIRKEVFTQAIEILGDHTPRLIGTYLSEASACFLLPAWLNYSEDISIRFIGTSLYTWKAGLTEDLAYEETIDAKVLSRELDIESRDLSLYASALLFYLQGKQKIMGIPSLNQNKSRLSKLHAFSKGLCLSLALFLCLFLGSYIASSWFAYQHQQSTQVLQREKPTLERIQTYKSNLREKQGFISSSQETSLAPSKIAWYIDQLSAIAPNELGFERILYKGKSKQLKKIDIELESREFDLLIQGESRHAHALTAFSLELAEKEWVQEVEIFNSQFDYRSQSLQFIFLVSISHGNVH